MIICPKCGCFYWEGEVDPTCGACGASQPSHDNNHNHNLPVEQEARLWMLLRAYHYVLNRLVSFFWRDANPIIFRNALRVMAAGLANKVSDRVGMTLSDEVERKQQQLCRSVDKAVPLSVARQFVATHVRIDTGIQKALERHHLGLGSLVDADSLIPGDLDRDGV